MDLQIEGDGVIDNFYQVIWHKQTNDTGVRGFLLPNTVIYKHQQPRAWYFSTKEGKIKKKHKEKLNANHIESNFLKKISKSGIIASFMFEENSTRKIEYFQQEDFRNFLHNRHKLFDGVLQQFIDPKGSYNNVIQMIWTPHLCLFEYRENQNDLFEKRLDVYERVVTFESEDHQSQIKPFKGVEMRNLLQEIGEALVEHFFIVSQGKIRPSRMVLVFKTDFFNRPWLLMATSIRCSSQIPLNIDCNTKFPEVVNCKRSNSNIRSPLCVQKKVLCKNCEKACEIDRMYEIKYHLVVQKNESEVPHLIKRNHTSLNFAEYQRIKFEHSFSSKVALVCDECYLLFVKDPEVKKSSQRITPVKTLTPVTTDRTAKTPTKFNSTMRVIPKKSYPRLPELPLQRILRSLNQRKTK